MKTLILAALLAVSPMIASAHPGETQTYSVPGSYMNLSPGETESLNLGANTYVQKIIVQAEGVWRDAMFEVVVNGDVKGTVYTPGRDPSYVVTVDQVTSSIQFRNISGSSAVIRNVTVVAGRAGRSVRGRHELSLEDCNNATELALRAMQIVDELSAGTNYKDQGTYLLPIKRAAATVYAKARARGDQSYQTIDALSALRNAIDNSADYMENSFTVPGQFELATELLSLREEIDAILN